jgi:cytochrome P450
LTFAPADLGFVADPYPRYAELRRDAPVRYDEGPITGSSLATRTSMRCCATGDSAGPTCTWPRTRRWAIPIRPSGTTRLDLINADILDMEPHDHTRVRRLFAMASRRGSSRGWARVQAIMDELVDEVADAGELDPSRDPNPHLTFGAGIHFCLGAPVRRQELQISFATVMDRFPNLELVEEPRWKPNDIVRGARACSFDPERRALPGTKGGAILGPCPCTC